MGREVVGNAVIERSVTRIETAVSNGSTMSTMAKDSTFPTLVARWSVSASEVVRLTPLQAVVDYYDDLVPRKIKTFFAALEPGLTNRLSRGACGRRSLPAAR